MKNWMCHWLGMHQHSTAPENSGRELDDRETDEQGCSSMNAVVSTPSEVHDDGVEVDTMDNELEELESMVNASVPRKVFSLSRRGAPDFLPPAPETLDRLTSSVEFDEDKADLRALEDFMRDCDRTEKKFSDIQAHANRDEWSYPESIQKTPNMPDAFFLQRPSPLNDVKELIRLVRGDLARMLAEVQLIESTGRSLEEEDISVIHSVFFAIHDQMTPLSSESVNLKMAAMRLDLQAMEVQVEKFRDMAQQCRDIVETMRYGYHVSRTAYRVALKTADALFDAYQREICKSYVDPQDLSAANLPAGIRTRLEERGCHTIKDLALMSNEQILSIPEIGPVRRERIRKFFQNNNLPALCTAMLPIHEIVGLDWRSVAERNESKDHQWMAPKCYGNMVFEARMDGQSTFIYTSEVLSSQ
ncbi:hypothetical protein HF670_07780 [Acidithiobacillus thiooxidans]|uniref:hypothetical protein n=1 Tax=Acidithiobacillus TaxID=119977 RepID=UPI000AAB2998|nr:MULTISPECIES: hypothetical protein [Acidithiobacillus]MBU2839463.1 hypothetical protein [Acidithiobacillus thiooxidans]MBU2842275.1 hypothetical protein [Acidithiobacillus thiooxidans]MDA8175695.1 hypothetical protein [Acidithiobacillus sp.]